MIYLLDTDLFTLAHQAKYGLRARIDAERAASNVVAISIITRIEVLRGRFDAILKAADAPSLLRLQTRLAESEAFLQAFEMIPFNAQAADQFNRLLTDKKFKKIGRGDLLIACIALAHDATLVTRNRKDFQNIPNLRIENWAD
jgi:tRNA(fMet)-specific endonuclease VapC